MKKLASVLGLGLAVSGIGGCGDDAPVPHDLRAEEQGLAVVVRSKDLQPGHR
jgi:hypothetical protein